MSNEMTDALAALAESRDIPVEKLYGILANALESAYKRDPEAYEYSWVTIDPSSFEIRVWAQELDEDGEPEGPEMDVTPENFGRIAAQTTKQVLMQGIREEEREMKYEHYAGKEGEIVTGIVQQTDSRYTLIDLGRVEALLPQAEQVSVGPRPESGSRLKAYIVEVRKTVKGPQIVVSRTHPGLVKRLFELEVPEIADGIVELKACAREPGHRTKIAVYSHDQNVDPVGACVGARGSRVRMVVNELNGEKVDIIPFSEDPYDFVAKALSPAKVKEVRISEETGTATVIVPDFQLSLAIGKEGQNARLAHRLTGWRIDIKSETQLEEEALGLDTYEGEEWAEGEWVLNEDTGEQIWQPADGSEAMTLEQWEAANAGDDGDAPADGEADESADADASDADDADVDDADVAEDADGADEDAADGETEVDSDSVDSDGDGEVNDEDLHPYGDGSHALIDGDPDQMPEGFPVKGNDDSKLYHNEDSPFYGRTKAEVWFASDEAAEAVGFAKPESQQASEDESADEAAEAPAADEAADESGADDAE